MIQLYFKYEEKIEAQMEKHIIKEHTIIKKTKRVQYIPCDSESMNNNNQNLTYFSPSNIWCSNGLRIYPLAVEQARINTLQNETIT